MLYMVRGTPTTGRDIAQCMHLAVDFASCGRPRRPRLPAVPWQAHFRTAACEQHHPSLIEGEGRRGAMSTDKGGLLRTNWAASRMALCVERVHPQTGVGVWRMRRANIKTMETRARSVDGGMRHSRLNIRACGRSGGRRIRFAARCSRPHRSDPPSSPGLVDERPTAGCQTALVGLCM